MIEYIREFADDESGVETMEWIALLAVAAILITIIAKIGANVKNKTKDLAGKI